VAKEACITLLLRGGTLSAVAWPGCLAAVLVLLIFSIYLIMLSRGLRNEQVINDAVVAMRAALGAEPPPQRALLSGVADALAAQERAAARVEVAVHEVALRVDPAPRPDELLRELLSLPEPQLLVAGFLREHAGGPGSAAAFASLAADMLHTATTEVFKDLADQGLVELDRLLVLADEGRIANVALASLSSSLDPNPPPRHVPKIADLDPRMMVSIVCALDRMTRRQLRLATVLHGQAEAMLRLPRRKRRSPVSLWVRVRALVKFPPPVRPEYQPVDLEALAVAFDAIGEVVDTAGEQLGKSQHVQAVHLLSGLRVPVPAGLPGRMYLQESLAQARPLARLGVLHRLAVCRWAASTLQAIKRQDSGGPDGARWATEATDSGADSADR
jgi:hypothetical protein